MKEITILSGKGGTGKTSITAALASLAGDAVYCDNDVDAADLHLIFEPRIREEHVYPGAWVPVIDPAPPARNAAFAWTIAASVRPPGRDSGAYSINAFQCEGCRLCERVCPAEAIRSERSNRNTWFVSGTRFGTLVHARMGPGEENSGKLVARLRQKARQLALDANLPLMINDGPPGIGCAAISSLSGTDAVLMVMEPTVSGIHDAKRLVELIESFSLPVFAVINKHDLSPEGSRAIETFLREKGIPLLGNIPFDEDMVAALLVRKSLVEYKPGNESSRILQSVWNQLQTHLNP
ncbi:MAG: ATP-binding protein [Bacteroidales bacterium]